MRASALPTHFCVACIECRKTFVRWTEHLAMHDRRRARRKADKDAMLRDGETERRWYPRGNREFRERAGRIGLTPRDRTRWLVEVLGAKLNYAPDDEMLKDIATFM